MAEIHIEKKRGPGAWLWIALIVVLLIVVAVYLWQAGYLDAAAVSNSVIGETVSFAGGIHGAGA
jgi:hypothetical protein